MIATRPGRPRIGDVLLGSGTLTAASLDRALAVQKRSGAGVKIGGILLGSGLVGETVLLEALSGLHRCPAVGWPELSQATPAAFALLGAKSATRLGAFPFAIEKRTLRVAFTDPSNINAIDEVAALTGCRVIVAVTSEVRLMQAHEKFYRRPISLQFTNILTRMSRPRPAATADPAAPAVAVPPPPPRFSGGDEAVSELVPVSAASSAVPAAPADPVASDADPFSDGYPLNAFLGDALAFGVAPPSLWKPGVEASKAAEEDPLDPGVPIGNDDLDSTRPSGRSRARRDSEDVDTFGFGSSDTLA
ncbi:MAG: hypothetical protein ABI592_00690 [Acidobacteriota bacterium]